MCFLNAHSHPHPHPYSSWRFFCTFLNHITRIQINFVELLKYKKRKKTVSISNIQKQKDICWLIDLQIIQKSKILFQEQTDKMKLPVVSSVSGKNNQASWRKIMTLTFLFTDGFCWVSLEYSYQVYFYSEGCNQQIAVLSDFLSFV